VSEISADPQKSPYGQKFLSRRKIFRVKNRVKFCIRECLEVRMGQKIRPRVSEDFLGPKVTTPQIWGSAEISTGLGVFLKILSYRIFWKKIFSHFLLLFFSIFFQKLSKIKGQYFGRKWPKLSNFVRNMFFEVFRHHLINILPYYCFYEFLWYGEPRA